MREDLVARLAHDLESFVSPWGGGAFPGDFVAYVLPRIVATLDLLPAATPSSRLLELGADPYAGSQGLELVWPGEVTHANYSGTGERRGSQTLVERGGSRSKTYEFDLFNIETDEFPYPDETFDVVIFAELIEHLAINPVWALAEMHRVLKPGGHLIVTTPNALSLERVGSALTGRRPIVDHYSPVFGYGARHNREYAWYELHALLEETGFDIETLIARDLGTPGLSARLRRAGLRLLLRPFSPTSRRAHLFVRARRRPQFRWRFPDVLFTGAEMYRSVRHPWVEMGVNDAIQCDGEWQPLEQQPDGVLMRRVRGTGAVLAGGSAILRGKAGRSRVIVTLRGVDGIETPVRIAVAGRDSWDAPIGLVSWAARSDAWSDVDVPLTRSVIDREELLVNVSVEPGREVAVRRIALA